MSSKIKASVIGVTGYTGIELLRILLNHPDIEIKYLTSRQHENLPLSELYPRLNETGTNLMITNTAHETVADESDVVFLCLPHMASQDVAPSLMGRTKIIDLSADFRLDCQAAFEQYYKEEHKRPDLLNGEFVYGLPEIYGQEISKANYVANPGCFALLVQVLLFPLKGHMNTVDVLALSGTSGGGRKPRDPVDHPLCAQNVKSYLINDHRHTPEITKTLGLNAAQMNFLPSVGPFLRGIFATAFIDTEMNADDAAGFFREAPFVRHVKITEMTNIVSTNYIDVSYLDGHDGRVIAQGALDNLLKGASGTAVQNMNLMFGLDEKKALTFTTPVYP